jgi:predicted aconitase with swiveling domain
MRKEFKGRPIISGAFTGECVVSKLGINFLATYQKSILKKSKKAIGGDQNNPDLYNKRLDGKIICAPQSIGSTTGGIVVQTAAQTGIGPAVFLFSKHIDSLAAAGVVLSDIWMDKKIITIDKLGAEFLETVKDGMTLEINEDGTVVVNDYS